MTQRLFKLANISLAAHKGRFSELKQIFTTQTSNYSTWFFIEEKSDTKKYMIKCRQNKNGKQSKRNEQVNEC